MVEFTEPKPISARICLYYPLCKIRLLTSRGWLTYIHLCKSVHLQSATRLLSHTQKCKRIICTKSDTHLPHTEMYSHIYSHQYWLGVSGRTLNSSHLKVGKKMCASISALQRPSYNLEDFLCDYPIDNLCDYLSKNHSSAPGALS